VQVFSAAPAGHKAKKDYFSIFGRRAESGRGGGVVESDLGDLECRRTWRKRARGRRQQITTAALNGRIG